MQLGVLGLGLLLSADIGLEREVRHKSAGLPTHRLVGVGAALFMLVSKYGFSDVLRAGQVVVDPSRVGLISSLIREERAQALAAAAAWAAEVAPGNAGRTPSRWPARPHKRSPKADPARRCWFWEPRVPGVRADGARIGQPVRHDPRVLPGRGDLPRDRGRPPARRHWHQHRHPRPGYQPRPLSFAFEEASLRKAGQLQVAIPPGSLVRRVAGLVGLDRRLPGLPRPAEATATAMPVIPAPARQSAPPRTAADGAPATGSIGPTRASHLLRGPPQRPGQFNHQRPGHRGTGPHHSSVYEWAECLQK